MLSVFGDYRRLALCVVGVSSHGVYSTSDMFSRLQMNTVNDLNVLNTQR